MEIYLDNGATTLLAKEVEEAMRPWQRVANASSLHASGNDARRALASARAKIASSIGALPTEIVFTSSGSEANNLAIKGFAFANRQRGNHIITTNAEHKCVKRACEWLETQGFNVTYLPVDNEGYVTAEQIEKAITPKTIMATILHANNEIGTINDLEAIGKVCKEHKIALHTDACQSHTKIPIDVRELNLSFATINSHKIHGPKGVSALFVKRGVGLTPLIHGGEQERSRRAGTENVTGIVGFAAALDLNTKDDCTRMAVLRDKLIKALLKIEGSILNGPVNRLCNNVNISFTAVEGEAVVGRLDEKGIRASTGSACSEASLEPSYVLKAIGQNDEGANGSLRLTLSRYTTEKEIERVIEVMPDIIKGLREISPIWRCAHVRAGNNQTVQ